MYTEIVKERMLKLKVDVKAGVESVKIELH